MSFFGWKRVKVETADEVGLSDEKKAQIDAVVASWGEVKRSGRKSTYDGSDPPVQILTAEEIAYFVQAMEAEAARIDAEATELQKRRLAEIAERDSQIASINREIEAIKSKLKAEDDEIHRRAEIRAKLLETVEKIEPGLDASKITRDADIRREVVLRRFGDEAVNGRSEAYIDDRFESLEVRVNVDPLRQVLLSRDSATAGHGDPRESAYQEMLKNLADGWKH